MGALGEGANVGVGVEEPSDDGTLDVGTVSGEGVEVVGESLDVAGTLDVVGAGVDVAVAGTVDVDGKEVDVSGAHVVVVSGVVVGGVVAVVGGMVGGIVGGWVM